MGSAGWALGLPWNAWFSRNRLTGTSARCNTITGSNSAAVPYAIKAALAASASSRSRRISTQIKVSSVSSAAIQPMA